MLVWFEQAARGGSRFDLSGMALESARPLVNLGTPQNLKVGAMGDVALKPRPSSGSGALDPALIARSLERNHGVSSFSNTATLRPPKPSGWSGVHGGSSSERKVNSGGGPVELRALGLLTTAGPADFAAATDILASALAANPARPQVSAVSAQRGRSASSASTKASSNRGAHRPGNLSQSDGALGGGGRSGDGGGRGSGGGSRGGGDSSDEEEFSRPPPLDFRRQITLGRGRPGGEQGGDQGGVQGGIQGGGTDRASGSQIGAMRVAARSFLEASPAAFTASLTGATHTAA